MKNLLPLSSVCPSLQRFGFLFGLVLAVLVPIVTYSQGSSPPNLEASRPVEPQLTSGKKLFIPVIRQGPLPNRPPMLSGDSATVQEDQAIDLTVLTNDRDPEGAGLTVTGTSNGKAGQVTRSAAGTLLRYTPLPDYHGLDSFHYWASDGQLTTGPATVTLTIISVNDPPIASNDAREMTEDGSVSLLAADLTKNDTAGAWNETDQSLRVTAVAAGASTHGTVSLANGIVTYRPAAHYFGDASFNYTVCDDGTTNGASNPQCASATVAIEVRPINDAPSFSKGPNQSAIEDSGEHSLPGWATNLSRGPANESGQTLGFIVANSNPGLFASAPVVEPDGTLRYTLAPDANGRATVSVYLHDSGGTFMGGQPNSPTQTFTIAVSEINDPITVYGESKATWEETSLSFAATELLENDTAGPWNESGQSLQVTKVTPGAAMHGTLSWTNGTITYVPDKDYFNEGVGVVHFAYEVCDHGTTNGVASPKCATAEVQITVRPVNDAPSFSKGPDDVPGVPGTATEIAWASNISAGPANESDQVLDFVVVADNLTLFSVDPWIDSAGTLRFTLRPEATGTTTVSVLLKDDGGSVNGGQDRTAVYTFTITIQ
jgi:large repetitive protein